MFTVLIRDQNVLSFSHYFVDKIFTNRPKLYKVILRPVNPILAENEKIHVKKAYWKLASNRCLYIDQRMHAGRH